MIHIYRKYVVSRYFHFFDLVHGVVMWRFIPLQYLYRFSCMSISFYSRVFACLVVTMIIHSPFEYNYHMFYMNQEIDIYPPALVPLQVACKSNAAFQTLNIHMDCLLVSFYSLLFFCLVEGYIKR